MGFSDFDSPWLPPGGDLRRTQAPPPPLGKFGGSVVKAVAGVSVVGVLVTYIVFLALGAILHVFWNWFIPGIFPSLPNLNVADATGLVIIAACLFDVSGNESILDRLQYVVILVPFAWLLSTL